MPFRYYRAQAQLPISDIEHGPYSVNTFHYRTNGADSVLGDCDAIIGALGVFYVGIQALLASTLTGTARVQIYDLTDGEPRAAKQDSTITFDPGAGDALPSEVAMCLSYRGAFESGVNRRRNRGRIYLGPLDASVGAQGTDSFRPTAGAMDTLAGAGGGLVGPISYGTGGGIMDWCVFSRAEAGVPVGTDDAYSAAQLFPAFRPVSVGFVDDAFDTQRRRGADPTSRATFG